MNLGKASVLQWKDDSGYQWKAELLTPSNYVPGRRYPLIIQPHGAYFDEFLTDGIYTTANAARPLAGTGFVVVQMPMSFVDIATRREIPNQLRGFGPDVLLAEWEIYAALRMQKKPVDLMYLPQTQGYQHILQRPLDRLASQQGNVDWFRFWLQGYEDSDPAKAAQYRRWEAMRRP